MVKRKTVMAREDLANRLKEIAEERGCSLYSLVNEIFQLTIESEDMGVSLRKTVEDSSVLNKAQTSGFVLVLENLWYEMVELAYQERKEETRESWSEAGVWLAKQYLTGEAKKPFERFIEELKAFTWNAPEFTVEKSENGVSIRIINPRFPEFYTRLYSTFLESGLETFGYQIGDKGVSRGTIRLKAVRKEEDV
ncbi:MAG: hypothetical protein ACOC6G_02510 [Thermoproteota archaeon]